MVHVFFYANLRTITGQSYLEFPITHATTLRELLLRLADRFPDLKDLFFNEKGCLYQDVPIFVNGRNPRLTVAGLESPLGQDDMIALFSPIASGRMNVEGMRTSRIDEQERTR